MKWWHVRFFFRCLGDRLNTRVCRWLDTPVRRYWFPRLRVQLRLSRSK